MEIDWDDIEYPDNVKQDECISSSLIMIDMMINILLKGKGDTYREYFAQIKEAVINKTNDKKVTTTMKLN